MAESGLSQPVTASAPVPSTTAATPAPAPAQTPVPPSAAPNRFQPPKPPPKENPFVYLGIPQWVFDYRPKMPGPKMSVFMAVTIGSTAAYVYDRRECKRIQQEYIDKVKWMSEDSLETTDMARKVRVLAARVPEDGTTDRSTKWFKRYMRPYFVAAGIDFEIKTGINPGGLGRTLITEIRAKRLVEASKASPQGLPSGAKSPFAPGSELGFVLDDREEAHEANLLDGGLVVLGRGALKEYLWSLKKGYGQAIDLKEEARLQGLGIGSTERRRDSKGEREEELLVRELEKEDALKPNAPFDIIEPDPVSSVSLGDNDHDSSTPSSSTSVGGFAAAYAPYRTLAPSPAPAKPATSDPSDQQPLILPPRQLPPQPPLLLVPFSHAFGVRQWPSKMLHFFNHRSDVRHGAELAMAVILKETRPFEQPVNRIPDTNNLAGMLDLDFVDEIRRGEHKDTKLEDGVETCATGSRDLDLCLETDELPSHFYRSYREMPKGHEFRRREFYEELKPRLQKARELANGRTPTSAEEKYPPKIESELRKERVDKEMRWRWELEGWAVQRSGSGIAWDEKWSLGGESPFKVFLPATEQSMEKLEREKNTWNALQSAKEQEREARWASTYTM
ncbi:hypothetical protein T439DRAFT_378021 [Meredithblackwellia eburnea MCA 4105]